MAIRRDAKIVKLIETLYRRRKAYSPGERTVVMVNVLPAGMVTL